jgi:hypothetical protein
LVEHVARDGESRPFELEDERIRLYRDLAILENSAGQGVPEKFPSPLRGGFFVEACPPRRKALASS